MAMRSSPVKKSLSKWLCSCLSTKKRNEPDRVSGTERPRPAASRPVSAQPTRSRDRAATSLLFGATERRHVTVPLPRPEVQETVRLLKVSSSKQKSAVKVSYGLMQFISCQPQGEEKEIYKFLCPICFRYFDCRVQITKPCLNSTAARTIYAFIALKTSTKVL